MRGSRWWISYWRNGRNYRESGGITEREAQKALLFLPGQLTDGIEASDDPLIDVRTGAYAVSFSRRNP